MKPGIKKEHCYGGICLLAIILSGCGGQPENYDEVDRKSVFVWRDTAYAEHPAVAEEDDPNVPLSSVRRLVGKRMTLRYMDVEMQEVMVDFDSAYHCNVTMDTDYIWDGWAQFTYSDAATNNYKYTVTDAEGEGKKASLSITYTTRTLYSISLKLDLEFTDTGNATATIQEFKVLSTNWWVGERNFVAPGHAGQTTWTVTTH